MDARSESAVATGNDVKQKITELNRFFERKQVIKMAAEFLEVHRTFHAKMQKLLHACREVSDKLPAAEQQLLEQLIAPYGTLILNPFPDESCGDLSKDIEDILKVINTQNEHFHKLLTSLMLSAANIVELQQLLEKIRQDPSLKKIFLDELKTQSWSEVGMHVTHPVQHLARYELLLKAFDKTLDDNGLAPTDKLRSDFSEAIVRVMPELTFFNEQRELLTQLNDVEMMLQGMTQLDEESREPVKAYVKSIRKKIAEHRVEVLDALEGLCDLLKILQKELEPTLLAKGAGLLKGAGYYGVTLFTDRVFGENAILAKPADPHAELGAVIASLETRCAQIRFVREKEGSVNRLH